ncbi:hypothetical protein J7J45_02610 [Candidatus Aerophobetes bacterium]|nr:hypothetical protein [Candidatus Aerophobetes bacterium]
MRDLAFIMLFLLLFFFFCTAGGFSDEKVEDLSLPVIFEYPSISGRDPFVPLVKEKKPLVVRKVSPKPKSEKKILPVVTNSGYTLVGIVWSGEEGMALIEKKGKTWIVKEGMILDGLRVARIKGEKGEVILIGKDKIIKLRLMEK